MTQALHVDSVVKDLPKLKAVDDLSFSIEEGEMFALLGPNGAGKSTTIGMISGLVRLGGGTISVFGHDVVREFGQTRRLIGVMPQEIVIDNFFTVERSLKIHSGYYGVKDDPAWRSTLIERLALGPYLGRKPLQLSGGTKRRLMLAKALIHKPRFLILDEPTAGVDVELRHNLWAFVREINARGTTVLLTTHYLEEAEKMCHRIAIMSRGKMVACDTTSRLLENVADRMLLAKVQAPAGATPALPSGWSSKPAPDHVELEVKLGHGETLDSTLGQLRALGYQVLDIQMRKADLEEVFLALTKTSA